MAICHFVSKKAFNIVGMGPKIINQLMDEGLVSDFSDLFELEEGDLMPLERFAEKSAEKLINSIQKSKEIPLKKFIFALGIRHAGEETAIELSNHFSAQGRPASGWGNLEKLQKAKLEDLLKIQDVGEVVAKSIYSWFQNKSNLKLLEKLDKVGVKILSQKLKVKSQKLKDKIFVLTGELESMTRDEAKEKIRALGGDISESVSKNTDFVVAGKEPGSKYEKAKELEVKIISEKAFLKIIK
jgi:DNA ligase (NAD+)